MNREIKFRAWNGREFIEDYYNHNHFISIADGSLIAVQHDDVCPEGVVYGDAKKVTLLQFTGLKDANGVEIYENSEIDGEFVVSTKGCDYVLISISSGDIVRLQDYYSGAIGNVKVTREYAGVQENP